MRRPRIILAAALAAVSFGASAASPSAGAPANTLYVAKSQYGPILFAGNGRTLYAFTRDVKRRSNCSGACLKAWPPFVVKTSPKAGAGARSALLGTIRRAHGTRQVTYGGRPLYYYVGETQPGQVLCQNVDEFGGLWLVVRGSGKLVR